MLKPHHIPDTKFRSTYRCMARSTHLSAIDDRHLSDLSLIKLVKKRVKRNRKLARILIKTIKLAAYEPRIDYKISRREFCHATHDPWGLVICSPWMFFTLVIFRECICPVITPYTGPHGLWVSPLLDCAFLDPNQERYCFVLPVIFDNIKSGIGG